MTTTLATERLIDALSSDLRAASRTRIWGWPVVGSAIAAMIGVAAIFGVGHLDIHPPPGLWLKELYVLALAATSLRLASHLGRPGVDARGAAAMLLLVLAIGGSAGAIELVATRPADRLAIWLGETWTICGRNILIVTLFPAPLLVYAMRKFAPVRPRAAGAALGASAGAIAAAAYGFFFCPEVSLAFVATWYSLGVAAAALLGFLAGRTLLRW